MIPNVQSSLGVWEFDSSVTATRVQMSNAGQWTNVNQLPDGTVIVTMVSVNMQCVFSTETAVSYGVQSCLALKGMGHMAVMCAASQHGTRGGCVKALVFNFCNIVASLSSQLWKWGLNEHRCNCKYTLYKGVKTRVWDTVRVAAFRGILGNDAVRREDEKWVGSPLYTHKIILHYDFCHH